MKALIKKLNKRDSFYNERYLFEGNIMEYKGGRWYLIDPLDIKKAEDRFGGNGFVLLKPEIEEQPEFKAGDEVEYQGSTISKVVHVFDGMAWIKNADQKYGSLVDLSNLRKPDPDKVYREIAKEIITNSSYDFVTQNDRRWVCITSVEDMLIEAIKKGKEL